MIQNRLSPVGIPALALIVATAFSPREHAPIRPTVSSFTVRRAQDRTFSANETAPVGNDEPSLSLTVKGSLVDLSTGADVVNASGSVVSGTTARIMNRQGGTNSQIDILVTNLEVAPPGEYRVRIRYAVETNGPDVVRIRVLQRGTITSITRDPTPALIAGAYTPLNETSTYRVTGTGLAVATVDPARVAGLNFALVSRSSTSLVFTLRPTQAGRYSISAGAFYDENLGQTPAASEVGEIFVRYQGDGRQDMRAAGLPAISISPQPSTSTGSIVLAGARSRGLSLAKIRHGHRYNAATRELSRGSTGSATQFTLQSTSATFAAAYDIASEPLELEFSSDSSVFGQSELPLVSTSVPFNARYAPRMTDVIASAEQATVSGVRVLRAGTATFTGKYLFPLGGSSTKGTTSLSTIVASPSGTPTVTLGPLALTVTATRYVAPTASVEGRDSVRVTLPDPVDNVVGQFRIETDVGSTLSPTFVLATRPRVNLITELTDSAPGERPVANQTLTRGRQYRLTGSSLRVQTEVGTVRIGGRPVLMQPAADPNTQLQFVVPQDATTGALVVATLGGETTVGTFTVAGSIGAPRPTALSIARTTVPAGIPTSGTVTLDNIVSTPPGAEVVLSSNHPAVTVPAVLRGVFSSTATFPITTTTVAASQAVTISATSGGVTQSRTLTVTPAVPASLSLNATDVVAGATVSGTLTLTAPVSNNSAALASSDAAAPVPATVALTGTTGTFSFVTTEAPAPRLVTITGLANGESKSATVTITPLRIVSVGSSLDTLRVGQTATITVLVNRAPATNVPLTIASSQSGLTQFDQSSIRLGSGQTSATVVLRLLSPPAAATPLTITVSRSVTTAGFGTVTTSATKQMVIVP